MSKNLNNYMQCTCILDTLHMSKFERVCECLQYHQCAAHYIALPELGLLAMRPGIVAWPPGLFRHCGALVVTLYYINTHVSDLALRMSGFERVCECLQCRRCETPAKHTAKHTKFEVASKL